MYIYAGVGTVFLYALYKERQSLGCLTIPDGTDCDNENGKAVKGSKPHPDDTTPVIFHKMELAAYFAERWVTWRASVLSATVAVMLSWFIIWQRIPTERELVTGIVVFSAVWYFTLSFYKYHVMDYVGQNLDAALNILKQQDRCETL